MKTALFNHCHEEDTLIGCSLSLPPFPLQPSSKLSPPKSWRLSCLLMRSLTDRERKCKQDLRWVEWWLRIVVGPTQTSSSMQEPLYQARITNDSSGDSQHIGHGLMGPSTEVLLTPSSSSSNCASSRNPDVSAPGAVYQAPPRQLLPPLQCSNVFRVF